MKVKLSDRPAIITDNNYRYDSFKEGSILLNKKKNHLPAMGWNSWNAFGSGNTEALTKAMADKLVELELDKLGYKYVVLDDGCYKPQRVNGLLSNEEVKFPSGFKALGDYIHEKGLLFGMYNDIGTNLCAGAEVGTCGHEEDDAKSYVEWGVDFIKVDNCYYLWDNATFSDSGNAKYTYAPKIKSIKLLMDGEDAICLTVKDGKLTGNGAKIEDDYACFIGTFDGTGPENTPVGEQSGELVFETDIFKAGDYDIVVEYATGEEVGIGSWLQIAIDKNVIYDDMVTASPDKDTFAECSVVRTSLNEGKITIRLMNHRRQENTLSSYAELLEGFNKANPDHDIILSICEWGKTEPQNWGYKVGDSWRILNDITFRVGSDGDSGHGDWEADYTTSVCAQYDKAVIMDEYSGLNKGWNDPDMLMIGMEGLDEVMCKTHMTMWCMMNSPLMLGMDLRNVKKGDSIWNIISNAELISLNQDSLGVQAKRIYSSKQISCPDSEYIRDNERVDILAKPLEDGSVALSFINLSKVETLEEYSVSVDDIIKYIGQKMSNADLFGKAGEYEVTDIWKKETGVISGRVFSVKGLNGCDNITLKITPKK